jgi:hypothetical protein
MAGRPKVKVYAYSEEGPFLKAYPSMVEFRKDYYPTDSSKRPLFTYRERQVDYHYNAAEGVIATTARPGRELIKLIAAIHHSEFCKLQDTPTITKQKAVIVKNLRGEIIAEFSSRRLAVKMMPDFAQAITSQLRNVAGNLTKKSKMPMSGLNFDYK